MKSRFSYFDDLVKILIDNKSKELGSGFVINKNKLNKVKNICEHISKIQDEIEIVEVNIGFDDNTGFLEIKLETYIFTISKKDSSFYDLLDDAIKFRIFSKQKGDTVCLHFSFEAVWDYQS